MAGKSESTGPTAASDAPEPGRNVASESDGVVGAGIAGEGPASALRRGVAQGEASQEVDAAQFVTPWRLKNWQLTALTASLVFCGLLVVLRFSATEAGEAAHAE
ncbi:MAG: hypothetical protein RJA70_4463, partial [Pseudomonadota bacterium]